MRNTISRSYQCCILLLYYYTSILHHASADAGPDNKIIFLLAGQSNMAGRGGVINNIFDGVVPPQCQPNPSVIQLSGKNQWVEAKEPLHRGIDINHTVGVGPGMAFANTILSNAPRLGVIGLVPCAEGGTNISQWARGSHLYNRLVRRAAASLRDGGSIQALVWYQGESDTVVKQDAVAYKGRLEKLFLDLRTDLQSPMLPIIQVAIASGEGRYIEEVRQAQMAVDLLNLKTVDALGFPLEPDNLHLTTPAQVHLGERLAQTFLQFLPSQVQSNAGNILVHTNTGNTLHIHCFYTVLIALFVVFPLIGIPVHTH